MVRSEYVTTIYVNFCGLVVIYLLTLFYLSINFICFGLPAQTTEP